jgi:F420-dependent methylenetetrahydromethanopterin dehydrogenase
MDKKEVTALEDLEFAAPYGKVKKGDSITLPANLADFEINAGRMKEVKPKAANQAQ